MLPSDILYAIRSLRKSPVFALTAICTIALGIGASAAIFSVTNALLLRPPPYKNPDRLVMACSDMRRRNVRDFPLSNADFLDLRNGATHNFEDFGAVLTGRQPLPGVDGTPEQARFGVVSTNFFRLMGTGIAFGRDFQDSDGVPQPPQPQAPAGAAAQPQPALPLYAILSYHYFQRRFGANTSIIGQPLPRGPGPGQPPPIVVGVLAPGFELLFPPESNMEQFPDIWFAGRIDYDVANRNNVAWRVIGRMKAATTVQRAQAEVETITEKIRQTNAIYRTAGIYIRLEPMNQHLVHEVRPAILALMGAVIFLLLIAYANVANLMLVRGSQRQRELAVRTALGGGWWRLVRQMLAEALVLAACGTLLGLGLAWFGIHELLVIAPANLPRLNAIGIDPVVLGFSVLAGLVAAAVFGVAPAIRAARPDVMAILRSTGRTGGLSGTGMLRSGVVVLEVALSFVLLIGSGLMFRTFLAIQRVDVGFEPSHLLIFQLGADAGPKAPDRQAFMRRVRDQLSGIPGVRAVTATFPLPLAGGFSPIRWGKADAQSDSSKFQAADLQVVVPGYFEAMHTPLLAGRTFTEADNTPDRNMLIVDQALAAKAFPNGSAVGQRILFRVRTPEAQWGEIIGVVKHQRDASLAEPGREQLYVTDGYMDHGLANWWALRTEGDPARYSEQVRAAVRTLGGQLVVSQLQPMDALFTEAQAGTRFSLLLIGVFGAVAALLAAVGLYGVLSTVVRQRTAEIGLRMALGAPPARIFSLVVGQGLRLSIVGIGIGLAAAFELTQVMKSMLVDVKPTDPATFTVMALVFFLIAAAASWLPARRAADLDPTEALRQE